MNDYQSSEPISIEGVNFNLSEKYGALVVYCNSSLRGATVCIDGSTMFNWNRDYWAHVIQRKVNDKPGVCRSFSATSPWCL